MNTKEAKIFTITGRHFASKSIEDAFKNEYNVKAIEFLNSSLTECDIRFLNKDFPSWQNKEQVNKYSVTLKNKKHSYTFDFYDSIKNTNDKKSSVLNFYNVLACLSLYYPENFDDFINEFGYEIKTERDYIRIKKIHLDCLDESKALSKLFTSEELEKLSEIN